MACESAVLAQNFDYRVALPLNEDSNLPPRKAADHSSDGTRGGSLSITRSTSVSGDTIIDVIINPSVQISIDGGGEEIDVSVITSKVRKK